MNERTDRQTYRLPEGRAHRGVSFQTGCGTATQQLLAAGAWLASLGAAPREGRAGERREACGVRRAACGVHHTVQSALRAQCSLMALGERPPTACRAGYVGSGAARRRREGAPQCTEPGSNMRGEVLCYSLQST